MFFSLLLFFAKMSLFAFGGGYVMIPMALRALEINGWLSATQLTDIVAIATMAPGPVGVNFALGLGYKVAGLPGALASFLGITIPTTILVTVVAIFFFKICKYPTIVAAFYGLRPVITGVIAYAVISLALRNGIIFATQNYLIERGLNIVIGGTHLLELKSVLIAGTVFVLLKKTKITPIALIAAAGILGMGIF